MRAFNFHTMGLVIVLPLANFGQRPPLRVLATVVMERVLTSCPQRPLPQQSGCRQQAKRSARPTVRLEAAPSDAAQLERAYEADVPQASSLDTLKSCTATDVRSHKRMLTEIAADTSWRPSRHSRCLPGEREAPGSAAHTIQAVPERHADSDHKQDLPSRPRRNRRSPTVRKAVRETHIGPENLLLPVFIHDGEENIPILSMPGVDRLGWKTGLLDAVSEARQYGVNSVVLFPKVLEPALTQLSSRVSKAYFLTRTCCRRLTI